LKIFENIRIFLQALAHLIDFSVGHKDTKARKKYGPRKGTKRHKEMSHRGHPASPQGYAEASRRASRMTASQSVLGASQGKSNIKN